MTRAPARNSGDVKLEHCSLGGVWGGAEMDRHFAKLRNCRENAGPNFWHDLHRASLRRRRARIFHSSCAITPRRPAQPRNSSTMAPNTGMNVADPVSSAISGVEFGVLNPDDIKSLSVKRIVSATTFDTLGHPVSWPEPT